MAAAKEPFDRNEKERVASDADTSQADTIVKDPSRLQRRADIAASIVLAATGLLLILAALMAAPFASNEIVGSNKSWLDPASYTERLEVTSWLAPGSATGTLEPSDFEAQGLHPGPVFATAFSPDGTRIVSGGYDGTLRLWDLDGQQIGAPFEGHGTFVYSVAFSPDGTRIVSGSGDGTLRLWDLGGRQIGAPFEGHGGTVFSVAFSPDGTRIVSGGDDGTLRLWDLDGQQIGAPFEGHGSRVLSVAFSPDGTRIVSGGDDGTLRLWDLDGQQIGAPFEGHGDWVNSVAFSPDGTRIVSGGDDGTLRLWDLDGQQIGAPFEGHGTFVYSVAFSPDGTRIVSGGRDGTLRLWDLDGQQIGAPFEGHGDWVFSVAFSPDGTRIVSGSEDGTLRLWDLDGQQIGAPFEGHGTFVYSVAFSPDGTRIVSGGDDGTLRLWDLDGQQIGAPFEGHGDWVRSVAFSPDGTRIVSGGDDGTLRLWDLDGQQIGAPFEGHGSRVLSVAFSPDGTRIVSGGDDGTLRLWDLDGQQIGAPFEGHGDWVRSVAFSPDGTRIVSGGDDGTLRLWDLDGQQIGAPFQGHEGWVFSVAFSPDGTRIVSGGRDGTLRLWDLDGQQIDPPFEGHGGWVQSVAFSPDGTRIVSSGTDGTLRLWDTNTAALIATVPSGIILSVDYSSDGASVVVGDRLGKPVMYTVLNAHFGPPLWVIAAVFIGFGLLISAFVGGLRRIAEDPVEDTLEAVFTPDTPLKDPTFAGDTLNAFCTQVSRFLLNPNTGTPLSIAMTGDWGKGKSSAMSLIERQLNEQGYPVLWFNAWHHQKEEHLFASLMEEVRRKAMPGISSWQFLHRSSISARFRLIGIRLSASPIRFSFLVFLLVFAIALVVNVHEITDKGFDLKLPNALATLGSVGLLLYALSSLNMFLKPFQTSGAALLAEGRKLSGLRRFAEKLSFRDEFANSFDEVTKALGQKRLTIIIDDLDRCDTQQVVDVMEAINFLMSNGQCYILLGIHENPVRHALGINKAELARAHAIAEKGTAVALEDDEVGQQKERDAYADFYLEKLLNLRLAVPEFDGAALSNFIEHRIEGANNDQREGQVGRWKRVFERNISALKVMLNVGVIGVTAVLAMALGGADWAASRMNSWLSGLSPRESVCSSEHAEFSTLPALEQVTGAVTISADGKRVFAKAEDGSLYIWDVANRCVVAEVQATQPIVETGDIQSETPQTRRSQETRLPAGDVERGAERLPPIDQQTTPETSTTQRIAENPLLLLWVLPVVMLSLAIVRISRRQAEKRQIREIELGQRDSDAYKIEMKRCLQVIHNPDLTPRILMRFVNLSRYLTASLPPSDPNIPAFVRYLTMEMCSDNTRLDLTDGETGVTEIEEWKAKHLNDTTPVDAKTLEAYRERRETVKL